MITKRVFVVAVVLGVAAGAIIWLLNPTLRTLTWIAAVYSGFSVALGYVLGKLY